MSARWSICRSIAVVYVALAIVAFLVAAVRLHDSSEMPGLAAIELVLVALPWSLALGVHPLSRLGWTGMAAVVLVGIGLNSLVLCKLAGWAQRSLSARATGGATQD